MFTLAMLGNGTYGLSVIVVLPALKDSKRTFVIKHLAWLISCVGVLVLDGFVSLASVRDYLFTIGKAGGGLFYILIFIYFFIFILTLVLSELVA